MNEKNDNKKLWIILGIILAGIVLAIVVGYIVFSLFKNEAKSTEKNDEPSSSEKEEYEELKEDENESYILDDIIDVMKETQKKIYADQLLSFAKDVTNAFAEQKSELGESAPTCYLINDLKPSTKNKGCIIMDYDSISPANVNINNDDFFYTGTYANLVKLGWKVIQDVTDETLSSTQALTEASCPSTCVNP